MGLWDDLLPEMCNVAMDHLDIFSILRFPAVCTSWAAAVATDPPRLSGGPTLLTSLPDNADDDNHHDDDDDSNDERTFTLHDVSSNKTFDATTSGLKDRRWVGAKDDWLVTIDEGCNAELLRPLTGTRVRLPSFDTIPGVKVNNSGCVIHGQYSYHLGRIILCQTPAANGEGYLAIAMVTNKLLAFTRAGEACWTVLEKPAASCIEYADAIVHKGRIFAVSRGGGIYCWDMNDASLEPELLQPPEISHSLKYKWNLAKSGGGNLLLVCTYGDEVSKHRYNKRFDDVYGFEIGGVWLYELDMDNGKWQHISNLGDRALFLGASYPFSAIVPCGSKDIKANCVYITENHNIGWSYWRDMCENDLVVFDLDDESYMPYAYP